MGKSVTQELAEETRIAQKRVVKVEGVKFTSCANSAAELTQRELSNESRAHVRLTVRGSEVHHAFWDDLYARMDTTAFLTEIEDYLASLDPPILLGKAD